MSPQGAVMSEGSSGESISHFAAIRIRVIGSGALQLKVFSMDDVKVKNLASLVMQATNRIQPTRLVNFMEQRASFEIKTNAIDEVFRINRIVIFSKEVFTSYPGS